MDRIEHITADESLGYPRFAGGTVVTAEFLTALQEEIVRTIEAAGLTPDRNNVGQLAQAILALAAEKSGPGGSGPGGAITGDDIAAGVVEQIMAQAQLPLSAFAPDVLGTFQDLVALASASESAAAQFAQDAGTRQAAADAAAAHALASEIAADAQRQAAEAARITAGSHAFTANSNAQAVIADRAAVQTLRTETSTLADEARADIQAARDAFLADAATEQALIATEGSALRVQIADDITAAVEDEATVRAAGDDTLAQSITTLSTQLGADITAAVAAEALLRTNADGALATQINMVQSQFTADIAAAISTVETAYTAADVSLSDRIQTVQSQYETILAGIDALDGDFGDILASIDAAVSQEASARTAADGALSQRIDIIQASYVTTGAMNSAINARATQVEVAFAAADSALSQRIGIVESDLNTPTTGVKARLTATQTAVADVEQARVDDVKELRAEMNVTAGSVIDDTRFRDWGVTGTPSWSRWVSGGSLVVTPRPGGNDLTFTVTNTQQDGASLFSTRPTWVGPKNAAAYVIEVDATLVSGTLDGAGVYLSWLSNAGTFIAARRFAQMQAQGQGRVRYQAVFRRPSNYSGDFSQHSFYLFANWASAGFSPMAAKTITFHECRIRPATAEELGSGAVATAITTAIATERTATAQEFSNLNTRIEDAEADITSVSLAVTQETSNRVAQFNTLNTRVGDAQAAIQTVDQAVQDEAGIRASQISSLNVTTNRLAQEGITTNEFMTSGWANWNGQGSRADILNEVYPIGKTVVLSVSSVEQRGLLLMSNYVEWVGAKNLPGYRVEIEYDFTGSLGGSGVLFDWTGSSLFRSQIPFTQTANGGRQRFVGIFRRPPNFSGTFQHNNVYIMANWGGFAPMAAKTLRIHRVRITAASAEELGGGLVEDAITAAMDVERALTIDRFGQVEAKYGVKVDAGGRVTGFGFNSTANTANPTSSFNFLVDRVTVASPSVAGGAPRPVFSIGTKGGVADIGVRGDMFLDGTLTTRTLAAGAVTADKMSVNDLSAISANLGTIQVNEANIANANITRVKIAGQAVDIDRLQQNTVVASFATSRGFTWFVASSPAIEELLRININAGPRGGLVTAYLNYYYQGIYNNVTYPSGEHDGLVFRVHSFFNGGNVYREQYFDHQIFNDGNGAYRSRGNRPGVMVFPGLPVTAGFNTVVLYKRHPGTDKDEQFNLIEMWLTLVNN